MKFALRSEYQIYGYREPIVQHNDKNLNNNVNKFNSGKLERKSGVIKNVSRETVISG
jgi:hypothetical protein